MAGGHQLAGEVDANEAGAAQHEDLLGGDRGGGGGDDGDGSAAGGGAGGAHGHRAQLRDGARGD